MNRFFVEKNNIQEHENQLAITDKDDIKHLSKVLRLAEGDKIEVSDMNKKEYICTISRISNEVVECSIDENFISDKESEIDVVLFQCLPKSSKMDLIIQKSVEIGIKKIVPVVSQRCVVKIKDKKSENKKIERWQKIAIEAAKQCKRSIIPKIESIIDFNDILKIINNFDAVLIPYELEKNNTLKNILKKNTKSKKFGIIIGPEGGFEEEEINNAQSWGLESISLGPRILRTETAGILTTSIIMYELGDIGGS